MTYRHTVVYFITVLSITPILYSIGGIVRQLDGLPVGSSHVLLAAAIIGALAVGDVLRRRVSERDRLRECIVLVSVLLFTVAFLIALGDLFGLYPFEVIILGPVAALLMAVAMRSYSALVLAAISSFFVMFFPLLDDLALYRLSPILLLALALLAGRRKHSELAVILLANAGLQTVVLMRSLDGYLEMMMIGGLYSGAAASAPAFERESTLARATFFVGVGFVAVPVYALSSNHVTLGLVSNSFRLLDDSPIEWLLPAFMVVGAVILWVHAVRKWVIARHVSPLAAGTLVGLIALLPGIVTLNDTVRMLSMNAGFAGLGAGLLFEGISQKTRVPYWTGVGTLAILVVSRAFDYEQPLLGALGCLGISLVAVVPEWAVVPQKGDVT